MGCSSFARHVLACSAFHQDAAYTNFLDMSPFPPAVAGVRRNTCRPLSDLFLSLISMEVPCFDPEQSRQQGRVFDRQS